LGSAHPLARTGMIDVRRVAVFVGAVACASAFVSWNPLPAMPPSARSRFSARHGLGLRMADGLLEKIIERKKKEVEELKANPPPGVAERLSKMGTYKNNNVLFK
jgi:hypothetical protein